MTSARRRQIRSFALAVSLSAARVASALTYCVDVGGATCDGTLSGSAGIQSALNAAAASPDNDTVRLGVTTYMGPFNYAPGTAAGTLAIVGAGIDQTVLTIPAPSTNFDTVLRLRRDIVGNAATLSQLTMVAPAPTNTGGAIAVDTDGVVQDARIVAPPGSNGTRIGVVLNGTGSGVRRTAIDTGNAGAVAVDVYAGISVTNDSSPAFLEDSSALNGLVTVEAFAPLRITRSRVSATGNRAIIARGTTVTVEDTLITVDNAAALSAIPETSPGVLHARHVTAIGVGALPSSAGMNIDASGGGTATMDVTHSIFVNFQHGSFRRAGPGETATLAVSASILLHGADTVVGTGDTTFTEPQANLDVDPLLTADYHLQDGSPAIDAAFSPALAAGESATDLDGQPRIQDGNGDGIAARDMGAFEHPAVTTTTTTLPGCAEAASFDSVTCRLGQLASATAAGVPAGKLATKLQGLVGRAMSRVAAAESANAAGRVRPARKSLAKAAKALTVFVHRVQSRKALKTVSADVASSLATLAGRIADDARNVPLG
jgi:hypothetical protein